MFEHMRLRNFRTHTDTRVELGPLTLLLGGNNSGKSNFLRGMRVFSDLARRGKPAQTDARDAAVARGPDVGVSDLFPYRHRLAPEDAPIGFSCRWRHEAGTVEYELELHPCPELDSRVACRERMRLAPSGGETVAVESGYGSPSAAVALQASLTPSDPSDPVSTLALRFFRDLAGCYSYDLQPVSLRGFDDGQDTGGAEGRVNVAAQLGAEGQHLHSLLRVIKATEERTFNRFLALMQRFEPTFRGVSFTDETDPQPRWLFDLGQSRARLDEFAPDAISDGLLRAAAVALLAAMQHPPALLLLEEIENGVNQRNLSGFIGWLRQAAGPGGSVERGYNTQFVLTSHSVGVLREFADHLEDVYHFRVRMQGYTTTASRMSEALKALGDLGALDGEVVAGRDGIETVLVPPAKLTDLWFSGTIGGA